MREITITRTARLDEARRSECLDGSLFATERLAHAFVIGAVLGDESVPLEGEVSALFIRADGQTVYVPGAVQDGQAAITLPQSCYLCPGRFALTIFVGEGEGKLALYSFTGSVAATTTGSYVDPAHQVPDIQDIAAEYDAMQQAVADCESAVSDCDEAAAVAYAAAGSVDSQLAALASADEDLRVMTRRLQDMVDYGFAAADDWTDVNGNLTASQAREFVRLRSVSPVSATRLRLNGLVGARSGATAKGWTDTALSLQPEHTYRVRMWLVSGTVTGDNVTRADVFEAGELSPIGTGAGDAQAYVRTFTPQDGKVYNLALYLPAGNEYADARYLVALQDVTAQEALAAKVNELYGKIAV